MATMTPGGASITSKKKPAGISPKVADPWMSAIPGLVKKPNPATSPSGRPPGYGDFHVPATPTPAPTPPAGTYTLPTTNYGQLILQDPRHKAAVANASQQSQAALSGYQAAIRAGLVNLGYTPDMTKVNSVLAGLTPEQRAQFLGAFDEPTLAAATGNEHSVAKQLLKAYQDNLTQERNQFEDRGFADSGFRVQEDERQGYNYEGGVQDAIANFLSQVGGYAHDYSQGEYGRSQDIVGVDANVAAALAADPSIGPGGGQATLVSGKTGPGGEPVYAGPDGRLWTKMADGTVTAYVAPPAPDINSIVGPGASTYLNIDPNTGIIRKKGAVL